MELPCDILRRPDTRAGCASAHPVWKERERKGAAVRQTDRRALPHAQAEEEMAAVMQRNGEQTPTSKCIHDDRRMSHTPANGQVRGNRVDFRYPGQVSHLHAAVAPIEVRILGARKPKQFRSDSRGLALPPEIPNRQRGGTSCAARRRSRCSQQRPRTWCRGRTRTRRCFGHICCCSCALAAGATRGQRGALSKKRTRRSSDGLKEVSITMNLSIAPCMGAP